MKHDLEASPTASPVERLEELTREQCLALLATVTVGRLGVSIQALPAILPVNFALAGDQIVIRTVPGTKLDAAIHQRVVAFEVDDHDPAGAWGWSVLICGQGSEITDPSELAEARALPLRAWAFRDGSADRFLRIETALVSGRSFGVPPAATQR
ncbi:MAG: pyridoxamine 5'-phosphate oxidase family protein [Actinomycetota bacterium]